MKTIEPWSMTNERVACQEEQDATAGAPYYVAYRGKKIVVTRRCAEALKKAGKIIGAVPARDPGWGPGITLGTLNATAEGQRLGLNFELWAEQKESAGPVTWMLRCKEMHCCFPTKNPAKSMMLLCSEFSDLAEL